MKDWYGIAIRRFNNGNLIICKISWSCDIKPVLDTVRTKYETVDFLVFNNKNQMETAYDKAIINFYRGSKCLRSIPCQDSNSETINIVKVKIADEYECNKEGIHAVAVIDDNEYPEIIDQTETDLNEGFEIGDIVIVRRPVGSTPITGVITGFSLNQYNVRCADVEIFGHSVNTEKHALSSLSYPEEDYIVTVGFYGRVDIAVSAHSVEQAKRKGESKFEEMDLGETEVADWQVTKVENERGKSEYF